MTRAEIDAWADETGEALTLLEPPDYDAAILGIGQRFTSTFVVYDRRKVLDILTRLCDGDAEAAMEWFEVNTVGAWVGESTWCFVTTDVHDD